MVARCRYRVVRGGFGVSAFAGIAVGRMFDTCSPRLAMTIGSTVGVGGFFAAAEGGSGCGDPGYVC